MNDYLMKIPLMAITYIFTLFVSIVFGSLLYFGAMFFYISLREAFKGESLYEVGHLASKSFFKRKFNPEGHHFLHRLANLFGSINRIHLIGYITTILFIFILSSPPTMIIFNIGMKELNIIGMIYEFVLPCGVILWLILIVLSVLLVKKN